MTELERRQVESGKLWNRGIAKLRRLGSLRRKLKGATPAEARRIKRNIRKLQRRIPKIDARSAQAVRRTYAALAESAVPREEFERAMAKTRELLDRPL